MLHEMTIRSNSICRSFDFRNSTIWLNRGAGMANKDKSVLTRREILKTSVIAGGITLAGFHNMRLPAFLGQATKDSVQGGQYLGSITFLGESPMPMDIPMGTGLDGRLYTDLSAVGPDNPITPNDKFYVRTRASALLGDSKPWLINVTGLVKQPSKISLTDLKKLSRPAGLHLLECSGNVRDAHFGMLSVADWAGVPLSAILDSVRIQKAASHVLISGFDRYLETSATSLPGASWVFTVD